MGHQYDASCRACGRRFRADIGGGRRFEQLRCLICGTGTTIGHAEIGEPFQKLRQELDALDESASEADFGRVCQAYHQAVEAMVGACACGGRFQFGAPVRCPECRSPEVELGALRRLYD